MPPRRVLPKPFQKPHPPLYLACTQTDSFDVAADNGIGVLSSATFATTILAEHVQALPGAGRAATPVGASVNEYWGNNVHAFCGEDNDEARELAALSLKTFFGPDKPYIRDRVNAYEQLLESWGGVPGPPEGRLRPVAAAVRRRAQGCRPSRSASRSTAAPAPRAPPSARWIPTRSASAASSSPATRRAASAACGCTRRPASIEVILITQTETIPHEQALRSIEMFGKHVIPVCRAEASARPTPAGV